MKSKRFLSLLLCLCMVAALFTGFSVTASAADDVITYTVKSGDWLAKICTNHGLNYFQCKNAIMILNGFTSERQLSLLSIGQVIKLPASDAIAQTVKASTTTTTTTTTTAGTTTITTTSSSTSSGTGSGSTLAAAFYLVPHTVTSGETLASICNALGTSYNQYASMILAMNGISDVKKVWAGKTVYIPTTNAPASGAYYAVVNHKVNSGETITSICSNYGISYAGNATLINGLNGKTSMNKILVGQNVYVPVVSSALNNNSSNNSSSNNSTSNSGKYQISFNNPAGGNPSAKVGNVNNATLANAGDKVVIYPNPKAGYAQQSIKAVRMDSNTNIAITNNTFTMPEAGVAVTVTYSKGLEIQKQSSKYGTFETLVGGSSADSALYGDLVRVVPSPFPGYEVDTVSYKSLDGTVSGTVKPDDYGNYWFYMPNRNIKLTVAYKVATYYTLTGTVSSGAKTGTVTFEVDGNSVTKAVKNTNVLVRFNPAKGYVIDGTPSITGVKTDSLTKLSDYEYSFVVDSSAVTATVSFKNAVKYDIAKPENSKGSVRANVVDSTGKLLRYNVEEAYEGEIVEIIASPYTNLSKDYIAKSARVTYANKSTLVADLDLKTVGGNTFTMPGANVRVEVTFEVTANMQYKISKNTGSHGSFQCFPQMGSNAESYACEYGKTVNITAKPDANYSVSSVVVKQSNGTEITVTGSGNDYSFTMPAGNVTVYVKFAQNIKYVPTAASDDGTGVLYLQANGQNINSGDKTAIGTKVTLSVKPDDTKYVNTVTVLDGNGVNHVLDPNENGVYSYTIQEADYNKYASDNTWCINFVVTYKAIPVTEYVITHSAPVHGKYNILVDHEGTTKKFESTSGKAQAGDKVKIVVKNELTDSGYKLNKIIVDGIEVTNIKIEGSSYVYEFEMPAYDVTTLVTYAAEE